MEVIIVGAGLVGSLLAVYLARRGYKVDLYDRNPDLRGASARTGRAINLTLCDRGLKALDEVGIGDIVRGMSVPVYGRYVHSSDGSLAFQPYGNNNEALYSIQRGDLGGALLDFADQHQDITFHFNEKCVGLKLSPLTVQFTNVETGKASTQQAARVFGADGTFSAVRGHLQRLNRFNYSQEFLDHGYKELLVPASANAAWAQKKEVLHMWPRGGYMLLGFPNIDGSITCSLHLPFEGEPAFESLKTAADVVKFFEEAFPDVVSQIPDLGQKFLASPPNPMVTVRCSPWTYQSQVALIGDAAHVLFPYYGQGANAGFEDCSVLVECMDEYNDDWQAVFTEYERRRKPNMDAIADMCIDHYKEIRDLLGTPNFLLRKTIERKVNQMYPELYRPLYTMIAFTNMPYAEALRIDKQQGLTIDKIMSIKGIEEKLDSKEIEATINSLVISSLGVAKLEQNQARPAALLLSDPVVAGSY